MTHEFHDFRLDTFDTIDGQHWLWAESDPEKRYPVVALLDMGGRETDDPEEAEGGVVKLGEESFTVFTFGRVPLS